MPETPIEEGWPTDDEAAAAYNDFAARSGVRSTWDEVDPEIKDKFKVKMVAVREGAV